MAAADAHTRDYYEVLGVERDATPQQIKDAFRTLALEHHPDRSDEPHAEERFKEIAEAYSVLSDPERRSTYDQGGAVSPDDFFGGIDLADLLADLGFGFGDDAGLFGGMFGERRRRGPPRGRDVETSITISLEEVATGTSRQVRLPRTEPCAACGETGAASGTEPRSCELCSGTGQLVDERSEGTSLWRRITACGECHGRGIVIDTPCPTCWGTGRVETDTTLAVTIPAGIESGTALRIAGHGEPSPEPSGSPGDAYVIVRVAHDARFDRRGNQLWCAISIAVPDAVLGTEATVPTLTGDVRVTIPPGTQPGSVLRLAGRGLPRHPGSDPGDMYVAVEVVIPTDPSPDEVALYEELRSCGGEEVRRDAG